MLKQVKILSLVTMVVFGMQTQAAPLDPVVVTKNFVGMPKTVALAVLGLVCANAGDVVNPREYNDKGDMLPQAHNSVASDVLYAVGGGATVTVLEQLWDNCKEGANDLTWLGATEATLVNAGSVYVAEQVDKAGLFASFDRNNPLLRSVPFNVKWDGAARKLLVFLTTRAGSKLAVAALKEALKKAPVVAAAPVLTTPAA